MLLSFAIDPASTSAARRFLERPDVFNVSITRARHHVHLFHSIETCELPHDSLLGRYLLHASDSTAETRRFPKPKSIGTPGDLLPSLAAAGWEVIATDTSIAGMPIDILLCKDGRHLALDLIGTTGDPGHAVSIEKNLLLQRAGLTLVPVSLAEWITQRDAVLAGLTSHSGGDGFSNVRLGAVAYPGNPWPYSGHGKQALRFCGHRRRQRRVCGGPRRP